ncbi:MAG: hypothetical protein P8078_11025, partial [bacterium]
MKKILRLSCTIIFVLIGLVYSQDQELTGKEIVEGNVGRIRKMDVLGCHDVVHSPAGTDTCRLDFLPCAFLL